MREIPLTNCGKEFILSAASQKQRLDGRHLYDYRRLKIFYGIDRGYCHVEIGQTKVIAQVSSDVIEPKLHRPSDGVLLVNVELSPMTSPAVDVGRPTEQCIEMQRILEKTLRESRCLDLESLCIVSSKQVWQIRVDVHCVNNAGNMMDACSIASIAALAHFRLPDVTIQGEEVTIHSLTERTPIPLSLHHLPICCTFALFCQGKLAFVDPSAEEERVMEGKLVVGMNKHRELCCLQSSGSMALMMEQVMRCSQIAVMKVTEITELVQKALEKDAQARASGQKFGWAESQTSVVSHRRGAASQDAKRLVAMIGQTSEDAAGDTEPHDTEPHDTEPHDMEPHDMEVTDEADDPHMHVAGAFGGGGQSTWSVDDEEMSDLMNTAAPGRGAAARTETNGRGTRDKPVVTNYNVDNSGDEAETCTLQPEHLGFKSGNAKKSKKKKSKQ